MTFHSRAVHFDDGLSDFKAGCFEGSAFSLGIKRSIRQISRNQNGKDEEKKGNYERSTWPYFS